mgnify:FL=1
MNANTTIGTKTLPVLLLSLSLLLLTGCASNMSGLGGSTDLACPMPDGSTCKSMSVAYQDTYRKSSSASAPPSYADAQSSVEATASKPQRPTLSAEVGSPLLTGPRLMRIFIGPWTDADDNLMEGRRVFVKIEDSRWRLDHVKASLYRAYAPISSPGSSSSSSESAAPSSRKPVDQSVEQPTDGTY